MNIQYHKQYRGRYGIAKHQSRFNKFIESMNSELKLPIRSIDIIWVSDDYLRKMHEDYLEDNEFTDIMTFNLGSEKDIEAELYISLDRAMEHAETYHISLENELCRLLAHGLLHLAGYDDKEDDDREQMRLMEDYYLDKFLASIV